MCHEAFRTSSKRHQTGPTRNPNEHSMDPYGGMLCSGDRGWKGTSAPFRCSFGSPSHAAHFPQQARPRVAGAVLGKELPPGCGFLDAADGLEGCRGGRAGTEH